MNTSQEPTFDQDLSTVVSQLPMPIRSFFISGKVEVIARGLMQKYKLHIDQGAIMEREIILLLLGLKNPTEFIKTLTEDAQLDQQTVDGIAQGVNDQIFVPLQEEMKSEAVTISAQEKSQKPIPPRQQTATPAPMYAPPLQSPSYSYPEGNVASSSPVHPPPVPRRITPPSLVDTKIAVHAATSTVPKPSIGEKLLEDHEEPHIEFNKASAPLRSRSVTSSPMSPSSSGITPPASSTQPAPPTVRPYSSDPYREPIDET